MRPPFEESIASTKEFGKLMHEKSFFGQKILAEFFPPPGNPCRDAPVLTSAMVRVVGWDEVKERRREGEEERRRGGEKERRREGEEERRRGGDEEGCSKPKR